ncbi:hypothetical protein C0J52_00526 [Blattella germanica]|nr:hypothetical protein C0J52_00526 [Blattella germanica]
MLSGAIFPSPSRRLLPWQPPQSNQTFRASPGHKILERNTRHSVGVLVHQHQTIDKLKSPL